MSGSTGLSVNDVVNVTVSLTPQPAQQRSFGSLLILGDSAVIDTKTRLRSYTTLGGVTADFGTTAPEYYAADVFFSQTPQPGILYLGRWARTASSGVLFGAPFTSTAAQAALLTALQAVTSGGFTISVDGTPHTLSALNFSAITNLNGAATVIGTALTQAVVVWNATYGYFVITSRTSGTSSSVSFASTATDVSATLGLQTGQGGYTVAGIPAETPLSAVSTIAALTNAWYALSWAASTMPATSDYVAVAGLIEGSSPSHIQGITSQDPNCVVATSTTDVMYLLQQLGYNRTFVQYSSSSPYAVAAMLAAMMIVDFNANNTTITLKFQSEVGVSAETLNETQAATLNAKNGNVFVNYNNSTAIVQQGTMASGQFIDTVFGTDWYQNALQTAVYNVLYTAKTKVPQTDAGMHTLITATQAVSAQAVNNGLLAPGQWNGPAFGQLTTGQTLTAGFYTYAPPISTQSQSVRAARIAPPIQIAAKGAGAIHFASVAVSFNP